ncbi:MAG: hypothetical protein WCP21_04575 [Armatimonadota bacterium]
MPPYHWPMAVAPYMKNSQILLCPSRASASQITPAYIVGTGWTAGAADGRYAEFPQYGMNLNISGTGAAVSLGKAVSPSETVMLGESNWYTDGATGNPTRYDNGCWWISTPNYNAGAYYGRWVNPHNEGRNISFVDGHTKWFGNQSDTKLIWIP